VANSSFVWNHTALHALGENPYGPQ
jgi:hypothetical protein